MSAPPFPVTSRLAGRRALVTGAARGIGRAIAARLLAEGAAVTIVDADGDAARTTAAELAAMGQVAAVHADLGDPAAIPAAIAACRRSLGGIDVVVNNAGTFSRAPIGEISPDDFDRVFAVNTRAPLLIVQAALDDLRASPAGRVVNIASMAARKGTPGESVYAASKAALVALTRIAAQELGPDGITVNAVCPGYVLTDLGADTRSAADVANWQALSPLGRLASTSDVAAAVAFLASDDASYLTGVALDVTGGMTMA